MPNRIGDVFRFSASEGATVYFQYVAKDLSQLGSHVIRVFAPIHGTDMTSQIEKIVAAPVQFHVHVALGVGTRHGVWEKIGRAPVLEPIDVLFRQADEPGNLPKTSSNWVIWTVNSPRRHASRITQAVRSAEIGIVVNPFSVLHRVRQGTYNFAYPDFAQ
jgi:hypothetical protein